ncbi:MAG: hypothetical protein ACXIT9_10800 [Nitritalea sp.]
MDKRHEWENAWRQKLSEAAQTPSPELWERLETALPAAQKTPTKRLPLYRAVAAGIVVLLAAATWLLVGPSGKGLLPRAEEGGELATRTDTDLAGGQRKLQTPDTPAPTFDLQEDRTSRLQSQEAITSDESLKSDEGRAALADLGVQATGGKRPQPMEEIGLGKGQQQQQQENLSKEVAKGQRQRSAEQSTPSRDTRSTQVLPVPAPKRTLPEQEMFRVDLNGSLVAESRMENEFRAASGSTRSEKRSGFRFIEEEMDGDVRVLRIPGIGERIQQALATAEPKQRANGLRSLQEAKNEFLEGLFEKNME